MRVFFKESVASVGSSIYFLFWSLFAYVGFPLAITDIFTRLMVILAVPAGKEDSAGFAFIILLTFLVTYEKVIDLVYESFDVWRFRHDTVVLTRRLFKLAL